MEKKKRQRKIGESVKLTPNTVFSGLGDTEGFFFFFLSTIKTN